MPTLIKRLTSSGLVPVDYSANSLNDAAAFEPNDGIYTVANTFNRYDTLKLNAHFDRMEDSARRENIPLVLDRPLIRQALRQMIDEANFGDVRFRITVSRQHPEEFILSIEAFHAPSVKLIEEGVRGITVANSARENAAAKTTEWMHKRQAIADAMPAGIYETFLLDSEGNILEGTGSNFYAVLNGELRTANEGVLKGISQQIIFEIAPAIIPLNLSPVHQSEIPQLSEAFMTSSSRGIVPIVELDSIHIGSGKVGEVTKKLLSAYTDWLKEHLEPL
jgi:branched-chain amino acid aminotransferase